MSQINQFSAYHVPVLEAGDYLIRQEVQLHSAYTRQEKLGAPDQYFYVSGDRFILVPGQVLATFPPKANQGQYAGVLPHIELRRSTLPWERVAAKTPAKHSWLTLLLLDEEEVGEGKEVEIKQAGAEEYINKHGLLSEPGDKQIEHVTLLHCKTDFVLPLLPSSVEELALLAHVRIADGDAIARADTPAARAVVVGNRLTVAGRKYTAHLVSLENRLANGRITGSDNGYVDLVSLYSWNFSSAARQPGNLYSLLSNLDHATSLQLQLAAVEEQRNLSIGNFLRTGSVPLPHYLRAGGETVSWYRGPFVPMETSFSLPGKELLYQHPDELIIFNDTLGMLDMTYAAAWQLGRLMFINEPKLVQQLQQWKQNFNINMALVNQLKSAPHLQHFLAGRKTDSLPEAVSTFLLQCLRFERFPYNYLVPHDAMLPEESIRFFKVDLTWLRTFLYGALSLGEAMLKIKIDRMIDDLLSIADPGSGIPLFHGVLIRSQAIAGWPGLDIQAAAKDNTPLPFWSKQYLSDGVLLCVFSGKYDNVTLFLPHADAHFGFQYDTAKNLAQPAKGGPPVTVNSKGRIDIITLARQLRVSDSAALAVLLLQEQSKVSFRIE